MFRNETKRTLVYAAPKTSSVSQLAEGMRAAGHAVHLCETLREARRLLTAHRPDAFLTELRLAEGPTTRLIRWSLSDLTGTPVVVVTAHGSIATAVSCARLGVAGYFRHPVSADALLGSVFGETPRTLSLPEQPLPLDQALWEHIHHTVELSGSISVGAQVLGLERRSLRRMLGKYSP